MLAFFRGRRGGPLVFAVAALASSAGEVRRARIALALTPVVRSAAEQPEARLQTGYARLPREFGLERSQSVPIQIHRRGPASRAGMAGAAVVFRG
jgi:hypothetical protein